jgi:hypothetical protein
MNQSRHVHLHIANAFPHGNPAESASVLALWQEVQSYFYERPFTASVAGRSAPRTYVITLDAVFMLNALEHALGIAGSFDAWRQSHVHNANKSLAAALVLKISAADTAPEEMEAYEVATLFLQQLVVALNLVQPGGCRLLQTEFRGDGGHRYESQAFDAKLYYGAFRNLRDLGWWQRHNPGFDKVWRWLERAEGSHGNTAIKPLDKVLFTMVKLAQQRDEFSARTALLVIYQLEVLLDCRSPTDPRHLRNRIKLILGEFPEAADCIGDLYTARDGLLLGSCPVRRPPLVAHDSVGEFTEQLECQGNAIEMGIALVLVLLRELIGRDAGEYAFTESVALVPVA